MAKFLFSAAILAVLIVAGCAPKDYSQMDQKQAEAKYNQKGYEDAMAKAGRQKELDEQKKIEADRAAARGR